ncbi:uncharacterized protein EI90DRAFT_3053178 [Cantharellus anzutake]|uniref:uncharacterized protein n=1 Tax=Cantharellus anzutake TaxID=1750568 RepID=UPI0019061F08|nr:uncharacterized protein EI90DRAFT_3053178 [Cantharellus anzutake]KAF8333156.1 hypothetical protein EI90DRAFT_3053178 [Cantharellus anzutake]
MPSSLAQQPDRESGIEAIEAILAEALDSTSVGEDPLVESALTEFELQPRDVSALLGDGAFTTVPDELSRASRTLPAVEIPRSTANPTPTAERQFRSIQKTRRTFGLRPSSLKTSSAPQGKHSGPGMEHGPTPNNLIDPHIYISTLPGAVRFKREQVGGDYDRLLQFVPRSDKRVLDLAIPPLARNGSISLEGRARAVRTVEKLTSSA